MLSQSNLEAILNRTQEWTRSADQKVSILVAIEGLLLALPLPFTFSWFLEQVRQHHWVIAILSVLAIATLVVAFGRSLYALIPRLDSGRHRKSALYFGDIATCSHDEYRKQLEDMSETDYVEDLVSQIHTCSLIATEKHQLLRGSIQALVVGLACAVLAYVGTLIT